MSLLMVRGSKSTNYVLIVRWCLFSDGKGVRGCVGFLSLVAFWEHLVCFTQLCVVMLNEVHKHVHLTLLSSFGKAVQWLCR